MPSSVPLRRGGRKNKGGSSAARKCLWILFTLLAVFFVGCSVVVVLVDSMKVVARRPASSSMQLSTTTIKTDKKNCSTLSLPKKPTTPHHHPRTTKQLSQEAITMCRQTLYHTLATTTIVLPHNETFIFTGDIDDLWLRDSAAQVHPYLVPLDNPCSSRVAQDPVLDRIVAGLISRHALYIHHDPYANAFRIDDTYVFSAAQKKMGRHDLISTWNYELDSGCYTIRLLYYYWKATSIPPTRSVLQTNPAVKNAVSILLTLWTAEQRHEDDAIAPGLDCVNCERPYRYPGLARNGKGSPTNASSGLTWSGFRPSDDEQQYGFLIPSNMMCVTVLEYVKEMASSALWNDENMVTRATQLQASIQKGIDEHAIVHHKKYGPIYAYEVDGLGNTLLMDDANVPSLLSMPYLEYPFLNETIYANTRRFLLSTDNPTYAHGTNSLTGPLAGIGSPHMKQRIKSNVWPMALAMQGMTTTNPDEAVDMAELLVKASAGTLYMHESVSVKNPHQYTRSWFCWADALYAELVLRILREQDNAAACWDVPYTIKEWRDEEMTLESIRQRERK